jgi:hypothetical protein
MTIFIFANNVNTTLAGNISTSATSLTLSSAANLPSSIPSGQVLVITLNDASTRQNYEIIYATSISGATLSGLLRGQEGTAALAWSTGDFAFSAPTKGQMGSLPQLGATNTFTGNNTFQQPVSVGTALLDAHAVNLGQFGGYFSTANGSQTFPSSETPSGLFILKYGAFTTNSSGVATATFTQQFPNGWIAGTGIITNSSAIAGCTTLRSLTVTGIEIDVLNTNGTPLAGAPVFWFAFGY